MSLISPTIKASNTLSSSDFGAMESSMQIEFIQQLFAKGL
jgi:hypothetical protein